MLIFIYFLVLKYNFTPIRKLFNIFYEYSTSPPLPETQNTEYSTSTYLKL